MDSYSSFQTKLQKTAITPIVALILVFGIGLLSVLLTSPPRPKGDDAPPNEFSAQRAFAHIKQISQTPHMSGSQEIEEVCSYIANQLHDLGLEVDIQSTTVNRNNGISIFANITNVVGRIKGTNSSKSILFVGHYDTQPHTPGAADDGLAVGSMLESASIIKNQFSLENDIIFLFTDAEEVGLLGAEAFAKEHPWMKDVGLVVNLEARGNKGTVFAFEVSPENGWIIREFIKGTDRPYAGSMMYEVYKLMPNDTDFTVFRKRGISGFNLALVEGFVNYHSATDTPENLSLSSLQHMGSYVVSIANHFGNISLNQTKGSDLVYFNLVAHVIVFFPANWNIWLFIAIVLLFIGFVILAIARKQITIGGVLLSFVYNLFVIGVVIGAVWGVNTLVKLAYPHYDVFYSSNFYNVTSYFYAYMALAFAVFSILYSFFLSRIKIANVLVAVYFLFILISFYILINLPTASYLTFIPLLLSLIVFNIILFFNIDKEINLIAYILIVLIGLIPFILVISPYIYLILCTFGLSLPIAGIAILLIVLLFALPLIEDALLRFWNVLPILFIAVSVFFIIKAHMQSQPSAERPLQSNIMYAALSNEGEAMWISSNLKTDDWNSQFFKEYKVEGLTELYPWRHRSMLKSKAEFINFEKPLLSIISDAKTDSTRILEFILKSETNPVMIDFIVPFSNGVTDIMINGKGIDILNVSTYKRTNNYYFRLINPHFDGDNIRIEYNGHEPLSLKIIEKVLGIPQFDYVLPMPEHIIPDTGYESYVTLIVSEMQM